jgi:hypothetical protein
MKNTFTLGAAAGITSLLVAVPALAQLSSAQESSATSAITRPAPGPLSQEDLANIIEKDTALLANLDAAMTLQKGAVQTRLSALQAASTIADETARQEAMRAAFDSYRTTIDAAIAANPDLKSAMHMGFGKGGRGHGGHGFGHGPGDLAEKLGMTEDELKAALDGGKTIEQIAEEKGIELPARPAFGEPMGR